MSWAAFSWAWSRRLDVAASSASGPQPKPPPDPADIGIVITNGGIDEAKYAERDGATGQTQLTLQSEMQERVAGAASGQRGSTVVFAARAVSRVRRYGAALRQAALFISVVSLAFSGVSLYETLLRQPRLTIFAGCNWQYGRGPGSNDEYVVIPVTVANDGARSGTVLAIALTVDKGGRSKAYAGNFTVAGLDDNTRQLFAPLAIAGRSSATASIVFTQRTPTGPPLVTEPGRYDAGLMVRTAVGSSYGFIDRLFASPPPELHVRSLLQSLDIAAVLGGERASFDACDLEDLPTAQAKSKPEESPERRG